MKRAVWAVATLSMLLMLAGCGSMAEESRAQANMQAEEAAVLDRSDDSEPDAGELKEDEAKTETETDITDQESDITEIKPITEPAITVPTISTNEIPAYDGNAYAVINGNIPYFTDDELSVASYEYYSDLDFLGRCGVCVASIGQDIMPTEDRGEIGSIKPSGWQTVKYPGIISGNYLYNRCHLIGYQLSGENANERNLITGTRYLNTEGMLPFENMVADFVKETGYHVMYRVTPVFDGDNLVADGVLIEAESVEDGGDGILFNVFCYNVQPGIVIDYATGDSKEDGSILAEEETTSVEEVPVSEQTHENASVETSESQATADGGVYAVNSKNGKIHITGACPATGDGSNAVKAPVYFGTYEEAEIYSIQIAPSQDKRQCGNCW